jgi:tight adherence protein C
MLVVAALLVAVGLGLAVFALARTRQIVADLPSAAEVALGEAEPVEEQPPISLVYRAIEPGLKLVAGLVRRLSPANRVQLLRDRIVFAGLEARTSIEAILAFKALAGILVALFALLIRPVTVPVWLWMLGSGVLGSFLPDVLLDGRARRRQQEIARDLPEALDLLAITVEAGLGLEQAIEVLLENLTGPLAEELGRMLREIELGVTRRDGLTALRARTDVDELSAFVIALIQADQMGAAIAQVLKVQASQVRLKRRQRARERAAQTPVKILFPLIFGVFPAIFIVTIGPGAIRIVESLFN